jgi:LmbE family N-acetylglucosaminyl deacetylase
LTERDPTRLGTILGVWAHPDDEAYLSAGIMAAAVDAGQRVVCITATRGELGSLDHERWPPETMASVREAELDACLRVLGVTEHSWLGYPDGGCADVPFDEAVDALVAVIEAVRPDTVLTFGPDGQTGHPDHIAVCRWTTEAVRRTVSDRGTRLYYSTATPEWNAALTAVIDPEQVLMGAEELPSTDPAEITLHVHLEGADVDRKVEALLCQESQVGPLIAQSNLADFARLTAEEFFRDP